jgi:acylphosphatase
MAAKRVHVFVSGQVQGVFYRAECARRARDRGLSGFVRNLPDGRVEAAFEGPSDAVDAMVAWCRTGPPMAAVQSVDVAEERLQGDTRFRVSH